MGGGSLWNQVSLNTQVGAEQGKQERKIELHVKDEKYLGFLSIRRMSSVLAWNVFFNLQLGGIVEGRYE